MENYMVLFLDTAIIVSLVEAVVVVVITVKIMNIKIVEIIVIILWKQILVGVQFCDIKTVHFKMSQNRWDIFFALNFVQQIF